LAADKVVAVDAAVVAARVVVRRVAADKVVVVDEVAVEVVRRAVVVDEAVAAVEVRKVAVVVDEVVAVNLWPAPRTRKINRFREATQLRNVDPCLAVVVE
jgi:hypothetical protein